MKKKTIIIAVTVLVLGAVISGAAIGCTAYINDKQLLDIGYHTPTEQLDYVIACHTDSRASLNDVLITYSHGFSIPWLNGGYVFPNIDRVSLTVSNGSGDVLTIVDSEYFDYIDKYYYTDYYKSVKSRPEKWYSYVGDDDIYSPDVIIMDAPTPVLSKSGAYYFSCQEELKLDREFFTEDEGFITFTLTEHYPDGSCEVKRELKLGYKHGALGTIEFFK